MKQKIYILTFLRAEDCDGSVVYVLKVGTHKQCKAAAKRCWKKYAKHNDIGDFDDNENDQWSFYIEDSVSYTVTLDIHEETVDLDKLQKLLDGAVRKAKEQFFK